ncbi:hypothetical protein, partial [Rhizorhapis sp. SPR117]|uniref:hypothetical protein n=1 Tax=Rhizorhapis sp. SPR117 TaxID=2912611 RepID=UPI001F3205D9|nr:hypothetical protein [Rhizorhapis sp. SPR117]
SGSNMGQISVKIYAATGSLLSDNQQSFISRRHLPVRIRGQSGMMRWMTGYRPKQRSVFLRPLRNRGLVAALRIGGMMG